ncbi:CBS domain-containing protein [Echinimonas agarilytica]|uniref:CBS domain-containing protein n=1 Tax=Echinimonas agarilytica TaxID=1215918 RepID=A0AA41W3V0_9GAMM|nr:CBS domain-containing protein [Echinimonas agarilytica]MCM2678194.1 CBS domain-containing protein [Echinimonas agarilytica]
MSLESLMNTRVVSVTMDDTLEHVKEIFENVRFHHVLVIEDDTLCGIVSDRDLFKALSPHIGLVSETPHDRATLSKKVHQIMTRHVITLTPNDSVHDAISLFNRHMISCIPVVNAQRIPVGVVSWRDIFKALEKRQQQTTKS